MSAANAALAREERASEQFSQTTPEAKYNVSIGYLRAFTTLLVLAHHAALAYHQYAPAGPPASLNGGPQWWRAFPIVDSQRWPGFTLLVGYNDIFFMSLMFFLSGLFAWKSIQRKGSSPFLKDRAVRLGLPFAVGAGILAPLAYYPTYLTTGPNTSFSGFTQQWLSLHDWPSGPVWFLFVLLAFDCFAAALFAVWPNWGPALGRIASGTPFAFFAKLTAISALAYLPLAAIFGVMDWWSFGPFTVQTSRALLYLVYFLMGAGVGAYGIDRGLLAPGGKLARRWPMWAVGSVVSFVVTAGIVIATLAMKTGQAGLSVLGNCAFAVCCASTCLALLALFVRFATARNRVFDSLRDNAYGMYLLHYAVVTWTQYSLLNAALPGVAKGALALLFTIAASWSMTALLRRIPAVGRVI